MLELPGVLAEVVEQPSRACDVAKPDPIKKAGSKPACTFEVVRQTMP